MIINHLTYTSQEVYMLYLLNQYNMSFQKELRHLFLFRLQYNLVHFIVLQIFYPKH